MNPKPLLLLLFALMIPSAASAQESTDPLSAPAAGSAAATVTGRVLNAATGMYLKNAEVRIAGSDDIIYTGDDGSYVINVPAGSVTLTASYANVRTASSSINAAPGAANVLNFELKPVVLEKTDDRDLVMLDRFDVTAEREGQAKAIMDQRAAPNAVTIISTDNFGDVTLGSVGEILKYMPGITLEYNESDTGGARIGGLDAKYTSVSLDDVSVSTSGRAVNLDDLTATGVESIEFVQTLTASMDAGSAAGRLNLKTKDPFSRKGRQVRFQFGLDGHSTHFDLGTSYLPDDTKHSLVFPGGQINYGDVFLKGRLAIEVNVSRYGAYNFLQSHTINYAYRNPDPKINPGIDFAHAEPVIADLIWRPSPRMQDTYAGNFNIGIKITPRLRFTLRSGYKHSEKETYHMYTILRARGISGTILYSPTPAVQPESTLTRWVVRSLGDNKSRLLSQYVHEFRTGDTTFLTPRLSYKRGSLTVDIHGGYSRFVGDTSDTDRGFFRSANTYLSALSWEATRPSTGSPTWTLTQKGGDSWSAPENWSKRDYYNLGIRSTPIHTTNEQYAGAIDVAYAQRIFGQPVTFKFGGIVRNTSYNHAAEDNRYNYLGQTGRPQEASIPWVENYKFDFPLGGKAGNINDQGWRVDDTYELYRIYEAHPDWFSGTIDNYRRKVVNRRDLEETIEAGYLEINTRFNRFRFNAGLRGERTEVETKVLRRRTDQEVTAAGYSTGTSEGIDYQYHHGERLTRKNSYSNLFLSGGIKYDITANLQAQISASQSILRPDYVNLAGVVSYDEDEDVVWVPNSLLKPEYLTKYYAGLHYHLAPAGLLSISAYRLDIKDKQIKDIEISKAEAERIVGEPLGADMSSGGSSDSGEDTGNDDFDAATVYRTTVNSPNLLTAYGITLEYNQQFTFLPGVLKGLSFFSSFTYASIQGDQTDEERIGQVKRSASGGFRYRLGRFNVQIRGSWRDDVLATVTRPASGYYHFNNDRTYVKDRLTVDLSGGLKLNKNYELTFSIRNAFNAPYIRYSNIPSRMCRYDVNGTLWNFSVKGTF